MDWIFSKLGVFFAPKYIGSVVRAVIVALGGALVSLGIPAEEVEPLKATLEPVLTGAITIGLGLLWSLVQKKKHSE